jgi:uncharacterized protein YyaL (SSP411 family)
MMITSMALGYRVTRNDSYLESATRAASFLKAKLYSEGKLLRRYRDEDARIEGMLDDYVFLIEGLISLFQADQDPKWLEWAVELQATQDELFWDSDKFGYFYSNADLIVRKKELTDGATPSANGIACQNLLKLADLCLEPEYKIKATSLLESMAGSIGKFPAAFTSFLIAIDYLLEPSRTLVSITPAGEADEALETSLGKSFHPNLVYLRGKPTSIEDKNALKAARGKELLNQNPAIYVCQGNSCKLPVSSWAEAKKLL